MALRKTFNYRTKLFLIVNVFFWILVFLFITIQYTREREYKISLLNTRLQVYNTILLREYETKGELTQMAITEIVGASDVRVTVIDRAGRVLYDNRNKNLVENHENRPEVANALKAGRSYSIRSSDTDDCDYFYSATVDKGIVMRTALPYDVTLQKVLTGDKDYIWVLLGITIVINIILYFAIGRFAMGVRNLRQFAEMAKKGDIHKFDTSTLPDDELGEVSLVIINMYKNLKKALEERDENQREALFEEKEKNRIKRQLTSNINHELKTPVQAIRGCFETLLNNHLTPEMQKKLLEVGYSNTMRLSDLLQDVALITQISDDKDSLEVADVDVTQVVKDICKDVDEYSIDKKMRIHVDMPDRVMVKGNRQLVDAIFRNLVNNAIAYSGGRDIFIKMTKATDDRYWFDFYDNGTGIEDKHLGRIFERFYRIDDGRSRKNGGTGLGLSIVRNAVLFHNGEIRALNKQYAGLEFIFSLHK